MRILPLDLSEYFQKIWGLSTLILEVKPEYGSNNPDHRKFLHERIAALKELHPQLSYSISHTLDLGGVFYCAEKPPLGLGWDIEISDRVSAAVAERIQKDKATGLETKPHLYWCAKEACYKSLKGFSQPAVISEVEITDWRSVLLKDSQIETCSLKNPHLYQVESSSGFVFEFEAWTLSFFISKA